MSKYCIVCNARYGKAHLPECPRYQRPSMIEEHSTLRKENEALQAKVKDLEEQRLAWSLDCGDATDRAEQAEAKVKDLEEEHSTLRKENEEAMELLDNVLYWETCPQEYVDRILALQGRLSSTEVK